MNGERASGVGWVCNERSARAGAVVGVQWAGGA